MWISLAAFLLVAGPATWTPWHRTFGRAPSSPPRVAVVGAGPGPGRTADWDAGRTAAPVRLVCLFHLRLCTVVDAMASPIDWIARMLDRVVVPW